MIAALPSFARRMMQGTFLRYIGASALALWVDYRLFLLLLDMGWMPALASAASYGAGIVVHWLISSRLVFIDGARTAGLERVRQKGLFLSSALVGLGLTVAIVWAGDLAGVDPRLSKLAAIGVSFFATYILRKTIVFVAR